LAISTKRVWKEKAKWARNCETSMNPLEIKENAWINIRRANQAITTYMYRKV